MPHDLRVRMVRLPVSGVTARLGIRVGKVLNLSIGGALLKLDRRAPIGALESLALLKGPQLVTVDARVLRVTKDPGSNDSTESWLVAVQFVADSHEMRPMITRLLQASAPVEPGRPTPTPSGRLRP